MTNVRIENKMLTQLGKQKRKFLSFLDYSILFLFGFICLVFYLAAHSCTLAQKSEGNRVHNYSEEQRKIASDSNDENPKPLKYIISYDSTNQEKKLRVNLIFEGNSTGSTSLKVPHSWAWQDDLEKGIKNLRPAHPEVHLIPNSDHTEYRIEHQPSQVIEIGYEVNQYWDQPLDRDVYYRPIINEVYFHFIGHGVFVYPEWDEKVKRKISVEWQGIDDDWIMANSFGIRNRNQLLEISIAELCHAAYMAGDFVLDERRVKGYPLYIVQRGTWNFTSSEFSNMVETVVKAVRGFWNDYDFPYFLVTLIPTDNEQSKGGTGLTYSFETFVSTDHESADDLKFLLAHELFHTWNGRKIQREEPEELVYWFSEGFTNYYTRLILLRSKLITLKEYISDYNRAIKEYYFSPAIHSTNEEILKKTHIDRHVERIPYFRGDLLATRWNALIKKSSGYSLDNVMFDILTSAQKSNMLVSAENVDLHARKYLKSGIMEDIERFVNKGEIIVPGKDDLGFCLELTDDKFHRFDIGFEYIRSKTSRDWHVTKVNPKGPAFKAGLRVNDTIVGRSIYWDRTEMPVTIKFKNQSGEIKTIEYLPLGELIQVPQYRLKDEISEWNDCLEWFSDSKKSRRY